MVKISLICLSNVWVERLMAKCISMMDICKNVTDWLSEWVSEIVTTREAIASNKFIFSLYFLFCGLRVDFSDFVQCIIFHNFKLLLWLKSLWYVYQIFVLRGWWPNVSRSIQLLIFAKTSLTEWPTDWVSEWNCDY